jgi:protease-4
VELFKKVGVTWDGVKTNKYSDMENACTITGAKVKPFTADERQIIQAYVNRFVDMFYTRCADGRSKTKHEIDAIGQGRVWTGSQALQNGLVDELGGLDDAIRIAAERAELTEYDINSYPKKKDPFTQIMEEVMGGDVKASLVRSFLGDDAYKHYMMVNGKKAPLDVVQAVMIEY